MPSLIVRNLEESLVRKLKKRAGEHGVSMEEEHRKILRDALAPARAPAEKKQSFMDLLRSMPEIPEEYLQRPKDYGRDIEF